MSFQCRVVLVRPRDPNNIGAAARAMKNFGLTDLFVVAPHPPIWQEVVSAVNATDVIANARVVTTLAEAVADCTFVVGTGDPIRIKDKQALYTPANLLKEISNTNHRVALVFGPEKHGLTNDDLNYCHRILSIPTQPDCPSMNLGQAVAICCYELMRDSAKSDEAAINIQTATAGEIEVALKLTLDVLRGSDFILPEKEDDLTRKLRRSLLRVNLSKREVAILCAAMSKIKDKIKPG